MSIKIISTQVYEDFEEKYEEAYEDYNIKFLDKSIVINYNNNEIIYDNVNSTIEIKRSENNIFIKLNEEVELNYETPYGGLTLSIYGEKINMSKKPFALTIEYKIKLGNVKEYKNIIEILEY